MKDATSTVAIRVLVVDDHWVVREGLRRYLTDEPGLMVIGEASNGNQAIALARELKPDVILMDILMPQLDGIEATARIKAEMPKVEIIALTSVLQDHSVSQAIQAGVTGYLLKDTNGPELLRAIRSAVDGKVQLSPGAATRLAKELRFPDHVERLTDRETEILKCVADGLSNKEIARRLSITEKTVKAHLNNVFAKLGVHSRTQAALHAIRTGLASLKSQ
jgi:two-component system, NarL family, response regulator LiaR